VPVPYPTIQSAVNDLTCTTINVAPGLYFENVTIPRTLTLNGAQAGNPAPGRVGAESNVTGIATTGNTPVFKITASGVTIDGFTVRDPLVTVGAAIGIDVKNTVSGATIENNIVDSVTTPDLTPNGTAQAVYLEAGPDNVQILDNDLRNIHSNRSAKGVTIGDASSPNPSVNVLIDGNWIENVVSDTRGAYGVSVNNGSGATSNSGLKITNNTITNLNGGGWVHGVGLEASTPGVFVRDNSFQALTSPSGDAVAVWFEANPTFSTGHVNYNNFDVTIADYGIAVQPTLAGSPVDGTCNWWGDPNGPGPVGPGAGAKVSPNVTYAPWLTAPTPVGACIGGASTPGKATGGGQIEGDPLFSPLGELLSLPALATSQATFGFVAACCPASGNLEYNDHGMDVRIKAESVDALSITSPGTSCPAVPGSKHATFTGTALVIRPAATTEEPYTVDVDDCGEPGTADTFDIKTTTYVTGGPSTLVGGNIQIH
jgi:hypothetical protein